MSVRAKFRVTSIKRHEGYIPSRTEIGKGSSGELHTVEMAPVYGNGDPNHENSKFWAASPGGSISLSCVFPEAVAQFELGAEMYIDFTLAPKV